MDRYWIAGFLEGEGNISCRGTLDVRAFQNEREMLDKLVNLVGGTVCGDNRTWFLLAIPAKKLLQEIYPIMSTKRKREIDHALERYKYIGPHNKNKTHCKHGHPFTRENTYLWKGSRKCVECTRIRKNKYYSNDPERYKETQKRYIRRKK